MKSKKVIVIGAGFSGLSAACFLAQNGYDVQVIEKHNEPGGRARRYTQDGFVFDMGPSWYWMPDVFDRFFSSFGKRISNAYDLRLLSPAFKVVFDKKESVEIPAHPSDLEALFESIEPGSAKQLQRFFKEAKYKYDVSMTDLIYRPGLSWTEYMDARLLRSTVQLGMLQSYGDHVRKYFSDSRLIRIMEFPVLFLGGTPTTIPALYSLMAYAGLSLGTWYPIGGMYSVVDAMHRLALDLGVKFHFNEEVSAIKVDNRKAYAVETKHETYPADHIVASADYHHIEQEILEKEYRTYSSKYWTSRVLAPSALIFFLGVNRKMPSLRHHTLFFDASYDAHAEAIYGKPGIPEKPLFYVCCPSVTDPSVAPAGHENLFVLIPLSTELQDSEMMRAQCFEKVMDRLEDHTGVRIREHLVHQRSYAMEDFKADYHALRGNAYGLANTLRQTALLKPKMKSRKVNNLYFTGQLTVPGPGVPPALISGEIAAQLIIQSDLKQKESDKRYAVASL